MKIGFIGLGRMGFNIVLKLHDKKIPVVAYNRSPEPVREIRKHGVEVAFSIPELINKLPKQKIIWIMVTAGKPVDLVINELIPYLNANDIIIDGGNSFYKDSIRRYKKLKSYRNKVSGELKSQKSKISDDSENQRFSMNKKFLSKKKIHFLDVGTSGGLSGARHGACLTIGGDFRIFKKIEWLCKAVSAKNGYAYVGNAGAGHFVKMVHNGIEYAWLQAAGEGFELLLKSPYKNLDFRKIAKVWKNGSIIQSKMMEWAEDAFKKDPKLGKIKGIVGGGETGQWALNAANEFKIPFETLKLALKSRKKSRKHPRFAGKVVAALRNEFGGHEVIRRKK